MKHKNLIGYLLAIDMTMEMIKYFILVHIHRYNNKVTTSNMISNDEKREN